MACITADCGITQLFATFFQKVCLFRNSSRYQTTLISDRLGTVESLALDWMGNILYWVDSDSATIEMAWTDGSHRRLLISNHTHLANGSRLHIEKPRSLVVYPKYGYVLWSPSCRIILSC